MTGHKLSQEARTRIETMVQTNDGFEIAEVDLKLRGPGDVMGTQQSGVLNLRIADIVRDGSILKTARHEAFSLLGEDPGLNLDAHKQIRMTLEAMARYRNIWNYIA